MTGVQTCALPISENIAQNLYNVASSIKILELPGLAEKEDVSDWLKKGGSTLTLKELASQVPEWTPSSTGNACNTNNVCNADPRLTELGNAQRLVVQSGEDLRYCYQSKKWLLWDGVRWRNDNTGEIYRKAKRTVQSIYSEASGESDSDRRKQTASWGLEIGRASCRERV